jgi:hypothetical protein
MLWHALALAEALVGHRVAGEHALAAVEHVIDDGARRVELLGLVGGVVVNRDGDGCVAVAVAISIGAVRRGGCADALFFLSPDAHDARRQLVVLLLVDQQDHAAVGLHVLEHQVHHHFEHLLHGEAAA